MIFFQLVLSSAVVAVVVVVAEEADIFLFSRTGCNPDENELFGGRNKQQCQREPSTYVVA
jgi:hypothetical protein